MCGQLVIGNDQRVWLVSRKGVWSVCKGVCSASEEEVREGGGGLVILRGKVSISPFE